MSTAQGASQSQAAAPALPWLCVACLSWFAYRSPNSRHTSLVPKSHQFFLHWASPRYFPPFLFITDRRPLGPAPEPTLGSCSSTSSLNVWEAHLFCVGPHVTLASPSRLQALCGQGPAPSLDPQH